MKKTYALLLVWMIVSADVVGAGDRDTEMSSHQFTERWTGSYVGGFVGPMWGEKTAGVTAGATIGHTFSSGPLLLGAELDAAWTDIGQDWLGGARGRIGVEIDSNWVLYVIGGLVLGNPSRSETATSIAVGAGVEASLTEEWSFRTEYVYVAPLSGGDGISSSSIRGGFVRKLPSSSQGMIRTGEPGGPGPWE